LSAGLFARANGAGLRLALIAYFATFGMGIAELAKKLNCCGRPEKTEKNK
jgi:hypothetical protein